MFFFGRERDKQRVGLAQSVKGELNVDKMWQSDDLFYIIMNESRPRVEL